MIQGLLISFITAFLFSTVFWLVLATAFGIRKNLVVSTLVLSVVVFGLEVILGVTDGLYHIWQTGMTAMLSESYNFHTIGAILALVSILAVIISAIAVFVAEAMEK